MTRINCIPVTELCNSHVLAEYRELPRIFSWLEKVLEKQKEPVILDKYCLGKGHMSFFADKLTYLNDRHVEIVKECIKRGFKINLTGALKYEYQNIPDHYWNDWTPTEEAQELNRQRINERLKAMREKARAKIKPL